MARRPLSRSPQGAPPAPEGPKAAPRPPASPGRRAGASAARFTVTPVEVDARLFLTVPPDHRLWDESRPDRLGFDQKHQTLTRAFVRLQPPHDASDAHVAALKKSFELAGAIVVVLPKPRGAVVLAPVEALPASATIRDVVMTMVEEANTSDRDALRDMTEEALGVAGI
jgi:hypothetical protein